MKKLILGALLVTGCATTSAPVQETAKSEALTVEEQQMQAAPAPVALLKQQRQAKPSSINLDADIADLKEQAAAAHARAYNFLGTDDENDQAIALAAEEEASALEAQIQALEAQKNPVQ